MSNLSSTSKKPLKKSFSQKKVINHNKVFGALSKNKSSQAQSAMEYLMTYGWSILIIAIALVVLFELGVFNGSGSGIPTSCVAQSGFLCSNPVMDTSGNVLINFGQSLGSQITITATACTNSTAPPNSNQWIQQPLNNPTFFNGVTGTLGFKCTLPSNTIGSDFSGRLWIQYQNHGVPNQETNIGVFTGKVGTSTSINLGNTGSGSSGTQGETLSGVATSPTITYNSNFGTTSTSATVSSGNMIFCAGAVGLYNSQGQNAGLTPSWTTTTNDIYSSTNVGQQTDLTCSASAIAGANVVIGAIGVTTNLPYTVTSSSGQGSGDSYSISYTLSHLSYVVILVACGEEGSSVGSCSITNNLPSGCSNKFSVSGHNDYAESVLGIVCNDQSAGSYSFNILAFGYPNSAMVSYEVYTFNLQTSPICASINQPPNSEIFLSGLRSTTLTSISCGATNFQWYEEAPGSSSFSQISSATSNTFTFSPPSSATTGTYQFNLQTSDNQGNQATSTPVNILVTNDPYAYVSNYNNVSIVDANTGNVFDSITSGFDSPQGIIFYSENAYVVNRFSGNVIEINPSNGDVIGTWNSGFNDPTRITFYSGNAYVTNSANVVEINPSNGDVIGAWTSGFSSPADIAFYSGNAYVVNSGSNNVVEINPSNGDVIGTWTSGIEYPYSIAFYSGNAYVTNYYSNNVVEINPSNGDVIGAWTSGFNSPKGIAFSS